MPVIFVQKNENKTNVSNKKGKQTKSESFLKAMTNAKQTNGTTVGIEIIFYQQLQKNVIPYTLLVENVNHLNGTKLCCEFR